MSWNIKTPGDYINGPLTVAGITQFNSNVGMSTAPSAWASGFRAIEFPFGTSFFVNSFVANPNIGANFYINSALKNIYKTNGFASSYSQYNGAHTWYTAASGAAGNEITDFAAAKMTLDPFGNLSIQSGKYIGWGNLDSLIYGDSSANFIYLRTNATEQVRIDSSGNVNVKNGNVVIGTSGKGIDFSATASGSGTMTSELFNDYEEGTWTGTLKGTTADPTTAVTATGRYTKVGRVVSLQIHFDNVNTTGASGVIYVLGAPFTNGGLSTFGTAASGVGATFTGTLTSYIGNAQTNLFFVGVNSNASTSDATHNAGSGRYFWLNTTYIV
jgi:hypothetical protein